MSLYYEMYLMFSVSRERLEEKYARLTEEEQTVLLKKGRVLVEEARKNGVRRMYYESHALMVYAAMKADGWDFRW